MTTKHQNLDSNITKDFETFNCLKKKDLDVKTFRSNYRDI